MTRKFLVVHGLVQNVGYRHFVWRTAQMCNIKGFVKNADDGSVQVLADGSDKDMAWFMDEIDIDIKDGAQVFKIDEDNEQLKKYAGKAYQDFKIES